MNEQPENDIPSSMEDWIGEFMRAAEDHERGRRRFRPSAWRRRIVAPLAALAIAGSAGVAGAAIGGSVGDSPDVVRADRGAQQYIDLDTGELIRCPDGEPLTYIPFGRYYGFDPTCSDRSVPPVFERQLEALQDFADSAEPGTPVTEGPHFAVGVDDGSKTSDRPQAVLQGIAKPSTDQRIEFRCGAERRWFYANLGTDSGILNDPKNKEPLPEPPAGLCGR